MKILFVCSGNLSNFNPSPFIQVQGDSLRRRGEDITYYKVRGTGFKGYFRNITPLKKIIDHNKFDIIHAHYALCSWVSVLTFTDIPIVTSFMGSDVYGYYDRNGRLRIDSIKNIILSQMLQFFTGSIIVKSENIKKYIKFSNHLHVLPNGVDISMFKPINKEKARKKLKLPSNKKIVLFLASKKLKRKNYRLVKSALNILDDDIKICCPYPVEHELVPYYYNAADVTLLSSYNEGSPNIIKEAMACNCAIVTTNVGDVEWVLGNTKGCYISSFTPQDFAEKINSALTYSNKHNKTNGRRRIFKLGLDSETVALKLISIYKSVLNGNN